MNKAMRLTCCFIVGLSLVLLSACGRGMYDVDPLTEEELAVFDLKISVALMQTSDGQPRLQIHESFVMPREGPLALKLPDNFLRKEKLYNRIDSISVSDGGILRSHDTDESVKFLDYPKGKRVDITYNFRPYDPFDAKQSESFSAPIIREDYFQFVGLMALIYPHALLGTKPFDLTFEWHVPSDFEIFNSFGARTQKQVITTTFDKLRDAFFVGGKNMRIREVMVRNQPVILTFKGQWDYISDDEFTNVVGNILAKQRETFADDNFPYFLINLLSVQQPCTGEVKFAGTAHPNSFRAFFPSGCRLLPEMKQLISHELMHMWIGKIIKVGNQRGHIDGKWFTEGWTDFFGRILAYRAGAITEKEYFSSLNRQLEKYYISNERLVTLKNLVQRMYRRGHSNRSLEDVPYQQGEIMAWRLNQRIKETSNFKYSLDHVIRDLLQQAHREGGIKNFSVSEIRAVVDRYAPGALQEEFSKVLNGQLFMPPNLAHCRMPQRTKTAQFFRAVRDFAHGIVFYGDRLQSCERWLQ